MTSMAPMYRGETSKDCLSSGIDFGDIGDEIADAARIPVFIVVLNFGISKL